ncbi:MAG: hypothetical protein H7831_03605 [Magnetococcus sp. WYHC-3]
MMAWPWLAGALGGLLLLLDLAGLVFPVHRPEGQAADRSMFFSQDIRHGPEAVTALLERYPHDPARFARELTLAISGTMGHPEDPVNDRHLRVMPWHDPLLALAPYLRAWWGGGPLRLAYEFRDAQRGLLRGVGLCSQHSLVLAGLLEQRGIETRIWGLGGHVVVSAQVGPLDNPWWILDADYGVVIPLGMRALEQNPGLAIPYYAASMEHVPHLDSREQAEGVSTLYGPENNHVYAGVATYGQRIAQVELLSARLKWALPTLLLLIWGLRATRQSHGVCHPAARRVAVLCVWIGMGLGLGTWLLLVLSTDIPLGLASLIHYPSGAWWFAAHAGWGQTWVNMAGWGSMLSALPAMGVWIWREHTTRLRVRQRPAG